MSNEIVKAAAASGISRLAAGDNPFLKDARESGAGLRGKILKFSGNNGQYQVDNAQLSLLHRVAFVMFDLEKGYVCWKGGKLVCQGKYFSRLMDMSPVDENTLPQFGPFGEGEGWREAYRTQVRDLDTGEVWQLMLSSASGVTAFRNLTGEYGAHFKYKGDGMPTPEILPIVTLDSVGFKPKMAPATKYAPKFSIVDWTTIADLEALFEGVVEDGIAADEEAEAAAAAAAAPAPATKPAGVLRPASGLGRKIGG